MSHYLYLITGPDVIHLGAGSERMITDHQTMLKTNKGDFHQTEKNILLKTRGLLKYITDSCLKFVNKICVYRNNYCKKGIDFKVSLGTKVGTQFFWFGPEFTFAFCIGATQSWVDVTVTAKSEQKSITSVSCLRYYDLFCLHPYAFCSNFSIWKWRKIFIASRCLLWLNQG